MKFKNLLFIGIITVSIVSVFCLMYSKYKPDKPNIILITIDALRPDHLGCYGYQRNTSPNIDRLAKEGVLFLNCYATSFTTVYSFPAFLTGRYLTIKTRDSLLFHNILDKEFTTLSEYLKNFGYYTAAFLNNGHLVIEKGFEQGFDIYENLYSYENAEEKSNRVKNFLNNYSNNKPFFIWIHFLDTHSPYSSGEKYFKIFEKDRLYKENDKILKLNPNKSSSVFTSQGYIPRITFHEDKYNLNHYIAYYDSEIRYTDFYIGRLLEDIKENTLIILSADHGEFLGEHGIYFQHGINLYDEVLHIPLIIKDMNSFTEGRRIPKVVSSVDVVPTILSRVNPLWYFFNKHRFDGKDLKRIVEGNGAERRYIYCYSPWEWSIRDVKKNVKYIFHENKEEELYLLPDEDNNLINDDTLQISLTREELRKSLITWLMDYPVRADINPKKIVLDEDAKEAFRSLGYLQ
jgi:arylsulfatase